MTDEELIEKLARALNSALALEVERNVYAGETTHKERCAIARAILPIIKAERIRGGEMVKEAAAAYVDGNGGTVIPGATVFAALVSGNFQPCMSGDARDRLPPHTRRRFDDATHTLTRAIRALSVPAIVEAGEHQPKEDSDG